MDRARKTAGNEVVMTIAPETAWVEAARAAADRAYEAVGRDMEKLELPVTSIHRDDAAGTNSADPAFLDYISKGLHLGDGFLAGVE